jgi:uncharacterized membrane protein
MFKNLIENKWIQTIILSATAIAIFWLVKMIISIWEKEESAWIYYLILAVIISIALWCYYKAMRANGTDSRDIVSINYLLTLLGISFVSWYFFEAELTTNNIIGMIVIVVGIIIFTT